MHETHISEHAVTKSMAFYTFLESLGCIAVLRHVDAAYCYGPSSMIRYNTIDHINERPRADE